MYKVDLPVDESSIRAVERRRDAEVARRKRIFSTRNRVIGLDVHALEQQVAERREREEAERQREMAYSKSQAELKKMKRNTLLLHLTTRPFLQLK